MTKVIGRRFFPTETFEAVVSGHRNRYLQDQRYTVRAGDADLAAKVEQWHAEGRVKLGPVVSEPEPPVSIHIAPTGQSKRRAS